MSDCLCHFQVVNLGDYRRKCSAYDNHNLFNPTNPEGLKIRNQVCDQGLEDAIRFIENDGVEVVVFDATNTTIERRKLLYEKVVMQHGYKLFFVESVCDDESIIDSNIRSVKVSGLLKITLVYVPYHNIDFRPVQSII